jgi:hypothetical protein
MLVKARESEMMARKKKEPATMMDFLITKLDTQEQAMMALIQPLPAGIGPSADFISSTRAQLVSVISAEASQRHAA